MRRKRFALIALCLPICLCVSSGLWFRAKEQQYALNRALIGALVKGNDEQALALVKAGADPNTRYMPNLVPTLPEMVKQLLHRSPPPRNDSLTAFSIACRANWMERASFSARTVAATIEMWRICRLQAQRPDDPRLIETMLQHGAQVNEHDQDFRWTPLCWAINSSRYHPATIRMLLHYGASVNWKDPYGLTPIGISARFPHEEILRLLIDYGADVNARTEDGAPLLTAAVRTHPLPGVMRLLLDHGANANARDEDGDTALHYAVRHARVHFEEDKVIEVIRQLVVHGANPNLPNRAGETAIKLAQTINRPDLVAMLKKSDSRK